MSDTLVVLRRSSATGRTIFAKNSNRSPNEPQIVVYIPSKKCEDDFVKTTYTHVPQVSRTNAVLLSKPPWMWGAEMGINEHGVAIGNEAVFTKEKVRSTGLLGMDLLRLALERSSNADEALEVIVSLLEEFGQGGKCFEKSLLKYHSSFIICDRRKAWILETADSFWVAKQVDFYSSLSNCLSIGDDFSLSHPDVVENAVRKKWCRSEDDFEFNRAYSSGFMSWLSGGKQRMTHSGELLGKETPVDLYSVIRILRDHGGTPRPEKGSSKSICAHVRPTLPFQTTSSLVCEIAEGAPVWLTGTSSPCLSLFKPVWFDEAWCSLPYKDDSTGENHWKHWERFVRASVFKYTNAESIFSRFAIPLQESFFQQASAVVPLTPGSEREALARITSRAFDQSWKLSDRLILELSKQRRDWTSPVMGMYWSILNKRLFGKRKRFFTGF